MSTPTAETRIFKLQGAASTQQVARERMEYARVTLEDRSLSLVVMCEGQHLTKRFNNLWQDTAGMQQANMHINEPSSCLISVLLSINRRDLRFITDHCHLNCHVELLGIIKDSECRWAVEEETSNRVLSECLALRKTPEEMHFATP